MVRSMPHPAARARARRERFLPFHRPVIEDEEIAAVVEVLKSGWLTTGRKVKEFENRFCDFVGASHAVAVNSGTAALHLALAAAGVGPGDEVIVPTMTFAATAEVVLYLGARPVLVDCEPDTLNIDPERLERALTPKTRAIVPVHFGGHPCEMDRIREFARDHGLRVIEDAAHALPARHRGRMVGAIGDITCFSFYATKTITTGEGGMATTENADWAQTMRGLSLHGISHDAWNRYSAEGSWYYEVVRPGYKYNLTDLAAGLGVEQLKKCEAFAAARRRIAAAYGDGFSDLAAVRTPACRPGIDHAWHLYVIQLELERLTIGRNEFIEELKRANIGASVHFIPLHRHPYYRDAFGYRPQDFPRASFAYERIVSLPIYPKMTGEDVDDVIAAVRGIAARYRR
ncbi:MAG TPA: DegT/DnrJ/EryC1/StrS family aminotransferase [Candidatus Acidoferrales bacterium]|nr:DegT/DnrJ/EryC1/StrS family aminotransferase [Candidatus Acidoferrales bacterium]